MLQLQLFAQSELQVGLGCVSIEIKYPFTVRAGWYMGEVLLVPTGAVWGVGGPTLHVCVHKCEQKSVTAEWEVKNWMTSFSTEWERTDRKHKTNTCVCSSVYECGGQSKTKCVKCATVPDLISVNMCLFSGSAENLKLQKRFYPWLR